MATEETDLNDELEDAELLVDDSASTSDEDALDEIRQILHEAGQTNWSMPEDYMHFAYQLADMSPTVALEEAKKFISDLRNHNLDEDKKYAEAVKRKEELHEEPITNAGRRGIWGFLLRQIIATINGTPFNALDWLEVNENGLQVYQPFSAVSQRTIQLRDIVGRNVVLSVNPPAYFDAILAVLRQFFRNVAIPWGQLVIDEPGSGRIIATAVAIRPDKKLVAIMEALDKLHRVSNRYAGYRRLPRLVGLLIYYNTNTNGSTPNGNGAASQNL
ncbi:hypothetical protein KFU94_26290 [Chloroflexi bacterium TSY]|nr:hypothetical protein [Chloroflexi bacterium TSY]